MNTLAARQDAERTIRVLDLLLERELRATPQARHHSARRLLAAVHGGGDVNAVLAGSRDAIATLQLAKAIAESDLRAAVHAAQPSPARGATTSSAPSSSTALPPEMPPEEGRPC